MYLIIGLGNPGKEYERTYHNIGFMVLDAFSQKNALASFLPVKKYNSLVSEDEKDGEKLVLLKPQTFMNNSGSSVRAAKKDSGADGNDIIVVHDDIDIALGSIRISQNSTSAGHKGVESIIQQLGTKYFTRIRVGIQPKKGKPLDVENFVLKKIPKEESQILKKAIENSCNAIDLILTQGLEKAMSEYNK